MQFYNLVIMKVETSWVLFSIEIKAFYCNNA